MAAQANIAYPPMDGEVSGTRLVGGTLVYYCIAYGDVDFDGDTVNQIHCTLTEIDNNYTPPKETDVSNLITPIDESVDSTANNNNDWVLKISGMELGTDNIQYKLVVQPRHNGTDVGNAGEVTFEHNGQSNYKKPRDRKPDE